MTKNPSEAAPDKPGKKGKAGKKNVFKLIWGFISSVKLTLAVLLTICVVSVIGTVVEQNRSIETYSTLYSKGWVDIILKLQLNDMYHSVWFTAILGTLVLNIVACTIERFPPKWRTLLRDNPEIDTSIIDKLSKRDTLEISLGSESVKDGLAGIFKKKKYKVKVTESPDGSISMYAWRGIIGRFGSDFTHVSLLVILLGSIIGNSWGYRDFKTVIEGGVFEVQGVDYQIRLDRFWIEYYDTGQIRQYYSDLTVVDNGEDVFKKKIWVNEPLYYKGIRFYQSSYGSAWNRVKGAIIGLKRGGEDTGDPLRLNWNELRKMPGTDYSLKVISYVSDFTFDPVSKTVMSKSAEANNPAVQLEVFKGDELISRPWLLYNYPGIVPSIPDSKDDLVFLGYRGLPYSGISINKDPGTNIVWLGCGIMGVGFYLAFFVYYRRIWVSVKPAAGSSMVKIGGMINKNILVFEKEFNQIVDALKALSKPGTREE